MPKIAINTPAPDFILDNFLGESVQLSNFKGRSNVLLVLTAVLPDPSAARIWRSCARII